MRIQKELGKQYDPKQVEDKIYQFWLDGGYFHARSNSGKKPYTIVIPPPNITGQLHMGHALDNTLQDILIRWRRMQGFEALWVPGTDHASIATEAKIVEAMREEGVSKDDIGRDGFLERAWKWKETYGGRIIGQLKKLGSSCDWERERFTLDEGCSRAVTEVFNRLYEKGLIYRGERIINWCPVCMTSISDAEVDYEEHDGHFWNIRYPVKGGGFLEIATTRPETLLGDTAVAVHPEDERYKKLIGKTVILPLMDREIPIIADEYVEMDFGTGVVKITPAHDPNDFEVGARHSLPIINVMNGDASINENGGKYAGMLRYEARKAVLSDLESLGFLASVKEHKHNVGSCYRCGTVVEPRVSLQWFVKMEPLAKPAIEAVKNGSTVFIPARFDKVYYNWMENIRDWCISRQLWWGHRIPAWHCPCGETVVARTEPDKCPRCGGVLEQDPDTLDTWFSSALWPFSTLGWPESTPELDYFYPTSTMVTGYDIIFFWVARMIFSGIEQMGETPFNTVFIHGLVRAADGSKMSKSAGNGIDPLEVIDEYGADALRFMLATGNSPGNDMRYTDEKTRASRNFANKIWNAARYILMNLEEGEAITVPSIPAVLTLEDKWILAKYNALVTEVTANLEKFELGVAAQKLYDFIWDILCDWYIELTKSRLRNGGAAAQSAREMLVFIMSGTLKLLHPFMPFLTEEIWLALPHAGESVMISDWPMCNDNLAFAKEETAFGMIIEAIRAVRAVRAEMNVPPSRRTRLYIETDKAGVFAQGIPFILSLASADSAEIVTGYSSSGSVQVVTPDAKIYIPMDQLVDVEKEKARLQKEKASAEKEVSFLEGKLANEGFISRAPQNVVEAEREKLRRARERLAKIEEGISGLK